jgi:hypothetical protein
MTRIAERVRVNRLVGLLVAPRGQESGPGTWLVGLSARPAQLPVGTPWAPSRLAAFRFPSGHVELYGCGDP